jgi:hypothetical protein
VGRLPEKNLIYCGGKAERNKAKKNLRLNCRHGHSQNQFFSCPGRGRSCLYLEVTKDGCIIAFKEMTGILLNVGGLFRELGL